jgi:rubrerythrin
MIGKTALNLKAAASGEHHEWSTLYPSFGKIAREEGFEHIGKAFEAISIAEKQHEKRYLGLLANIETGTVFKKEKPLVWRCRNCGYLHEGKGAPDVCPACNHEQAYFEVLAENW